ncbi:MAG: hypothetical protein GX660_24965 [Clostridiaceae bacterium]|nr:hypothetical protein [Clostridiaceae bacterium]
MNDKTIIVILSGLLLIAVIILVAAIMIAVKTKEGNNVKVRMKSRNDFLYRSYLFFSKFILTKKYIGRIRKRVEMLELSDAWTIGRNTMKFAYFSLSASFLMFIVLVIIDMSFYFLIISILTIYIVHNQILKILVDRIENKLLLQFEKFLGDVRHHFHEHGMIDEAIYDCIEECDYEISLHANRMYEILTSTDIEGEIDKYYDMAPNKFFKTFLALCHTVYKFGDKIVDDKSMFLSNLNYLKQEINYEVLKRERLNYLFKSLSLIAIAPIFTIKLIEKWAVYNLPELKVYYEGAYGFVVQVALFIIVILCYQLIGRMQSNTENNPLVSGIEGKILRIRFISDFVDKMIEKNYTKSVKLSDLLKNTGTQIGVKQFHLKSICYFLLGFMVAFVVFLNVHLITRHNILYNYNTVVMDEVEQKAAEELIKFDRKYILMFKGRNLTYQEVEKEVLKASEIKDKQVLSTTVKRILDKLKVYNSHYFKWWELIFCILLGVLFFNIPYWMLLFRKKVLQMGMEDEVMQFHTIIMMLMYIERMSVEDILQWMEEFAVVFKNSIQKCLNNFEHGDYEALEQLKLDEPYLPFTRLVENLQSAADKISITQAFDELIIERGYYQEKRKQDNEIIVTKKGIWGKLIAFIPLGATMFLYLLLPFAMDSYNKLLVYSEQIKKAL